MIRLIALVFVFTFGVALKAADEGRALSLKVKSKKSDGSTSLKVQDVSTPVKRAKFQMGVTSTVSTTVSEEGGNLASANRSNFYTMKPELGVVNDSGSFKLQVPMLWAYGLDGKSSRYIGRPNLVGATNIVKDEKKVIQLTGILKPPMVDGSAGGMEMLRSWEIRPGIAGKFRLSSSWQVTAETSLAYNSPSQTIGNEYSFGTFSYEVRMPLISRIKVGFESQTDRLSYGAALNGMSPIGEGRIEGGGLASGVGDNMPAHGYNVVAELTTSINMDQGAKFTASLYKSLRTYTDNRSMVDILASYDNPVEISYLGLGIGFSQSF